MGPDHLYQLTICEQMIKNLAKICLKWANKKFLYHMSLDTTRLFHDKHSMVLWIYNIFTICNLGTTFINIF